MGQWIALAAIPVVITALYFLKLKRRPLVVPSTYLWHKSIEDLHVNSFWQKLKKSLLLLLQLLLIALVILALVNPSWRRESAVAERNIFLIDTSASMQSVDVAPSRLDEAKRRALALVDAMSDSETAMVITFAESAQVVQSFTNNRHELRRAIEQIQPTDGGTRIEEALRMASGLANPHRSSDADGVAAADAMPAKLFILSDGRFPDVADFSLGNLDPEFIPIGSTKAANVGIVAVGLDRSGVDRATRQLYGRLKNFSDAPVKASVSLYLDEQLIDSTDLELDSDEASGVAFDLAELETGVLELRIEVPKDADQLAIDDRVWVPVNEPRRAQVLLVTPGNGPLEIALRTERARRVATVDVMSPQDMTGADYRSRAASGALDLIIYDRCHPAEMPRANTLFFGDVPPGDAWQAGEKVSAPQIIDADAAHPLLHLVELNDVLIATGRPLKAPEAGHVLIDSSAGALMAIAPREEFEDAVLGFAILNDDVVETNWPLRLSFPVFVLNAVEYFGPRQEGLAAGIVSADTTVSVPLGTSAARVRVTGPKGTVVDVPRAGGQTLVFSAPRVGVYEIRAGDELLGRIAANVLNDNESRISARTSNEIQIGHVKVSGSRGSQVERRETWKMLALAALAILLLEWYIFNRRVII